jgi:hypothetical protein
MIPKYFENIPLSTLLVLQGSRKEKTYSMYYLTLECRFVESRLKFFGSKLLMRISVIKGKEITVGWRQLEKRTS